MSAGFHRIAPGLRIPEHGHDGNELILSPPAWTAFAVLRDGTPIGHHRVQVRRSVSPSS